jgi:hypothetical protein
MDDQSQARLLADALGLVLWIADDALERWAASPSANSPEAFAAMVDALREIRHRVGPAYERARQLGLCQPDIHTEIVGGPNEPGAAPPVQADERRARMRLRTHTQGRDRLELNPEDRARVIEAVKDYRARKRKNRRLSRAVIASQLGLSEAVLKKYITLHNRLVRLGEIVALA